MVSLSGLARLGGASLFLLLVGCATAPKPAEDPKAQKVAAAEPKKHCEYIEITGSHMREKVCEGDIAPQNVDEVSRESMAETQRRSAKPKNTGK